jgi:hypothetical protein
MADGLLAIHREFPARRRTARMKRCALPKSPKSSRFDLSSISGIYLLMAAEAKKRTKNLPKASNVIVSHTPKTRGTKDDSFKKLSGIAFFYNPMSAANLQRLPTALE